ncbi:MAG: hypothetical protein M3T55_11980 [Pseudomonadota bacterium]|nr:hypothetical protein [Pseudomonadota bacterium]
MRVGREQAAGVTREGPEGKTMAPRPRKWTLRRTLSLVLIVSGLFWLIAGIAIHLLLF